MPMDLNKELTDLRRAILTMGSAVEQRVGDALDALFGCRVDLAENVRGGDREIDEMDVDIEAECLRILALAQPVAADLRFVLSVLRMNTDFERIGDEAKSIAKRVLDLVRKESIEYPPILREMAEASRKMLADALTALTDSDADLGRAVRQADEKVDELQKQVITWVQQKIPKDVEATPAAIDVLSIARRLERIADLATNVAEDVIFMLHGSQVRHARE
jgi:phosphate transport system protein